MLNHWDNVAVHPVMGQVERGYAGGSLFCRGFGGDPVRAWFSRPAGTDGPAAPLPAVVEYAGTGADAACPTSG